MTPHLVDLVPLLPYFKPTLSNLGVKLKCDIKKKSLTDYLSKPVLNVGGFYPRMVIWVIRAFISTYALYIKYTSIPDILLV